MFLFEYNNDKNLRKTNNNNFANLQNDVFLFSVTADAAGFPGVQCSWNSPASDNNSNFQNQSDLDISDLGIRPELSIQILQ